MKEPVRITQTPPWEIKVRAQYDSLSTAEQKVADCILSRKELILKLSISEVASLSGVSDATVVRLCHSLGFRGLKELKVTIAMESPDSRNVTHERSIKVGDSCLQIKQKVFYGCMEAIQDTLDFLDDEELERAVDAMSRANYIDVFALGGSIPAAQAAQHHFRRIGVRLNASTDIHQSYLMAERFNPGDVALAISASGETPAVVEALAIAHKKGATTICITSGFRSSITEVSDIVLYSTSREELAPGDYTYHRSAQMVIVDLLYAAVAARLPREST